jgi:hypothetical protein
MLLNLRIFGHIELSVRSSSGLLAALRLAFVIFLVVVLQKRQENVVDRIYFHEKRRGGTKVSFQ